MNNMLAKQQLVLRRQGKLIRIAGLGRAECRKTFQD
jgi:hypothetical protein